MAPTLIVTKPGMRILTPVLSYQAQVVISLAPHPYRLHNSPQFLFASSDMTCTSIMGSRSQDIKIQNRIAKHNKISVGFQMDAGPVLRRVLVANRARVLRRYR